MPVTWIGGLLRAGERRECMMPSVEGLRENRTEEATPYVAGVHVDWGVRAGEKRLQLASVEVEGQRASAGGRRFGVVGLRGGGQDREEIAAGKRGRREGFELLRGALFLRGKV